MAPNKKAADPAPPAPEAGEITKNLGGANVPAVATFDPKAPAVAINGRTFKVKQITRNVFPQRVGQTLAVTITGKIYEGEKLEGQDKNMAAANLAECSNLENGKLGLIIVNKVLEAQLNRDYPKDGYVGRSFAITMEEKPEGKRYHQFTVYELSEETA